MDNPLSPSCQGFRVDQTGKVIGVQLGITPIPGSRYQLQSVSLISETESNGQTVAHCYVLDVKGSPTSRPVTLGYPGQGPTFQNGLLPGNPNNTHVISNGYTPPALGPLALFVGTKTSPESDVLFGLGLPLNRHVSYNVIFRERGVEIPTPPMTDIEDLQRRVAELEFWRQEVADGFRRLSEARAVVPVARGPMSPDDSFARRTDIDYPAEWVYLPLQNVITLRAKSNE